MKITTITFPKFTGIQCLMMPYIQGDLESVPDQYRTGYEEILESIYFKKGDTGYLTIDESLAKKGTAHRGTRAKSTRALHTEVGRIPNNTYVWGGGGWGAKHKVELDAEVEVLLANNIDDSCALWDAEHKNTSVDGDIGDLADMYPYSDARFMRAGEVHKIGIFTPHESVPVASDSNRQFLRIISSGVHGREDHFTENPLLPTKI